MAGEDFLVDGVDAEGVGATSKPPSNGSCWQLVRTCTNLSSNEEGTSRCLR